MAFDFLKSKEEEFINDFQELVRRLEDEGGSDIKLKEELKEKFDSLLERMRVAGENSYISSFQEGVETGSKVLGTVAKTAGVVAAVAAVGGGIALASSEKGRSALGSFISKELKDKKEDIGGFFVNLFK